MKPKNSKRMISTNKLFSELFLYLKNWWVLGENEIKMGQKDNNEEAYLQHSQWNVGFSYKEKKVKTVR